MALQYTKKQQYYNTIIIKQLLNAILAFLINNNKTWLLKIILLLKTYKKLKDFQYKHKGCIDNKNRTYCKGHYVNYTSHTDFIDHEDYV